MGELLRNESDYFNDVNLKNVSQTGIKGPSIWYQLEYLSILGNVGVDVMYDLLEGTSSYICYKILNHVINKKQYLSVTEFNMRLKNFKRRIKLSCNADVTNFPPEIGHSNFKNSIFGLSARETLFFVQNSGLLIGNTVPEDDEFWHLYILHKKIVDFVMSPKIAVSHLEYFDTLISDHNKTYVNLTGEDLKPKFHHMTHYVRIILSTGPLVHS